MRKNLMMRMMSISKKNTSSHSMSFMLKRTNSFLLMGLALVAQTWTKDSRLSSKKKTLMPGRPLILGSLVVGSLLRTWSR